MAVSENINNVKFHDREERGALSEGWFDGSNGQAETWSHISQVHLSLPSPPAFSAAHQSGFTQENRTSVTGVNEGICYQD